MATYYDQVAAYHNLAAAKVAAATLYYGGHQYKTKVTATLYYGSRQVTKLAAMSVMTHVINIT